MADVKVEKQKPEASIPVEAPAPPAEAPPPTPEEICTPELLSDVIKGYDPSATFLERVSARLGTAIGDNYMSIMYAVEVALRNASGERELLNVMLKTMPRNKMRQDMINDSQAFVKDAKMYEHVLPSFEKWQEERGLKGEEIFKGWPKCYATFHDGAGDYLAMEDLKVSGYKMANRLAGLDVPHCNIVLKKLAQYHAISFAMFCGDGEKIMATYPWLEEKMFLPADKVQEPMKFWLNSMFTNEAEMVRKEGHDEAADQLKRLAEPEFDFFAKMNTLLAGPSPYPKVICHGDCWTNNFLFLYGDEKPVQPNAVKFVDFQLARVASRMTDLGYFLHSSIPLESLNQNETKLLKIYHDEFMDFLTKMGLKPEDFEWDLSWETFLEEYEYNKFYGVTMGFMLAPILSAEASDVPDMENLTEADLSEEGAKEFMNQLTSGNNDAPKKIYNLASKHLVRCKEIKN